MNPCRCRTRLVASLDQFAALGVSIVVPSHGAMGDARTIADYQGYLRTIQTRVRALKAEGKNADEAADIITRELQSQYQTRQPARIGPAVEAAFGEAP